MKSNGEKGNVRLEIIDSKNDLYVTIFRKMNEKHEKFKEKVKINM